MIKEIQTEKLPIKLWLDQVEAGALQQARNLANFPYAFHHIALMPDCHQGFGMPIGGVLATREVVVPNAVGVDIGCGMCAVRTSLDEISRNDLRRLAAAIREIVPVGFKHHRQPQDPGRMPPSRKPDDLPVASREYESALRQLGTLGGGNHFIELQKDRDRQVWVMIHTGSRNLGKQVADHYNRLARRLNQEENSPVPRSAQLAHLRLDSREGGRYWREMEYCVDFALANRELILERVLGLLADRFRSRFEAEAPVNIAHNYAALEDHFGERVVVHRKGATKADRDTVGIVPGSQGANSYIVRGRGHPDSFNSCSHGAGRVMGRKEAIRRLDLQEEIGKLESRGILHSVWSHSHLDEAAGAYKDIAEVMRQQADLVEILAELQPLAVIKG